MTQELKVMIGIGAATLVILVGGIFFLSSNSTGQSSTSTTLSPKDAALLTDNSKHSILSKGAKITLVEFADFQCPACGAAHPALQKILTTYKGKINFIYRYFPLSQHKNGMLSAEAAEAAGEQGKFWEMHDMLYENQNEWAESDSASDIFQGYAKKLGLNTDSFSKSLLSDKTKSIVQKDEDDGVLLGVDSTPTIFINNQKFENAATYDNLSAQIETELKK